MPKWGLTRDQIDSEPWGIAREWLSPAKTVTDAVHGDVYLNRLETALIDSPALQRLRGVRQLGTTHLVYPSATHSRFSHALGTLRAAQDLLDAVIDNRSGPRPADDLFADWATTPHPKTGVSQFDVRLAEVTVVMRLGALLHDICHVPFGHTIEDDLRVLVPHDRNFYRLAAVWQELPDEVRELIDGLPDLKQELLPLILSKDPDTDENYDAQKQRYPFVADIVGNTICADLIDYLNRDHLNTGLPMALGYRFTNDFYVSRRDRVHWGMRMVIRITRGSQRRVDVVTELLKYLRFRYELSERVLNHHAKLAADAMIGKLLEMWSDWLWIEQAGVQAPDLVKRFGSHSLTKLKEEVGKRAAPDSSPLPLVPVATEDGRAPTLADVVLNQTRAKLEAEFIRRGDDGLLEYLRDWGAQAARTDSRRRVVGVLADAVLKRKLFKLVGLANSPADRANSAKIYKDFGSPDARRKLEEGAAAFADLKQGWQIVIWVPGPKMRLKVAEVLIDDAGRITPLDRADFPGVSEIYRSHENLWAVHVYAHRRIVEGEEDELDVDPAVLRAYLSDHMGIDVRAPGGEDRRHSTRLTASLLLAVEQTVEEHALPPDIAVELGRIAASQANKQTPPTGVSTFRELKQRVSRWAEEMGSGE